MSRDKAIKTVRKLRGIIANSETIAGERAAARTQAAALIKKHSLSETDIHPKPKGAADDAIGLLNDAISSIFGGT